MLNQFKNQINRLNDVLPLIYPFFFFLTQFFSVLFLGVGVWVCVCVCVCGGGIMHKFKLIRWWSAGEEIAGERTQTRDMSDDINLDLYAQSRCLCIDCIGLPNSKHWLTTSFHGAKCRKAMLGMNRLTGQHVCSWGPHLPSSLCKSVISMQAPPCSE